MVRAYAIAGNINYGSTATSGTASTTTTNGRSNSTTTTSSSSSTTLANIQVTLYGDLNGDNITDITLTTTTDQNGNYSFPNLAPGTYTISVATTTLPAGSICTDDYDGATTPNSATTTVVASTSNPAPVNFSYRISSSGTSTGGTRTQGYWKTHASEWTCTSIRVGCTTYSREQAIAIMDASVRGDMTYAMFEQLVAAKLNVAGGSYASCILSTISAAETWLCAHPVGSNVGSSSSAWTSGADDLHEMLDDYNNGRLCAPHVN
jgi:hypothetical protein